MLRWLDGWLNQLTMYRLLLYYLIILLVIAAGLSALHTLHYNPVAITLSASYLTAVCWLTNKLFGQVFNVPTNIEAPLITALILALIISPLATTQNGLFLTIAGVLAMASKYILAINKQHIFNPAAIAVVLTAFGPRHAASWWVGSIYLLPFVVLGGLLIMRKLHREAMIASFLAAALVSTLMISLLTHASLTANLSRTILHSSLFFLAFIMLTEPLTSPQRKSQQKWYAAIVGGLFPPQIHLSGLYSTPELALIVGNVYSYIVSPKLKLTPRLSQKITTGPDSADFVFALDKPIRYKAGQYMEWTLGHQHADSRGNRRYFTLASSPTENNVRLGVKFYQNGSSYKRAMRAMDENTMITGGLLGGDFVLPKNQADKLAFIAGGIGITPYRSMIKYLVDTNEKRDVILLYSEKQRQNFVYTDVFTTAHQTIGLRPLYTLTDEATVPPDWPGLKGQISADMIKSAIPDYKQRYFYISGPHPMVEAVKETLHYLGLPPRQIKTDYFSGYA